MPANKTGIKNGDGFIIGSMTLAYGFRFMLAIKGMG